ncbi:MAG: hypothetical protein VW378_02205 [bacterium]
MKKIIVKNTYNVKIKGKPSLNLKEVKDGLEFAVMPSSISLIKPKLHVKEGDSVKIGTPIFFDKQDPRIQFCSPVSGKIKEIIYGKRRALDAVIITKDKVEKEESFNTYSSKEIQKEDRNKLVEYLLSAGLWPLLQAYPFKNIPKPEDVPPAIYVTIDNDEAFMPQSEVYVKAYEEELKLGLELLKKIANNNVFVGYKEGNKEIEKRLSGYLTHELCGDYPSNNPGIFLYYNKTSSKDNKSWGITGLNVARLGALCKTGKYPIERIITIGGPLATSPCHIKTREGIALSQIDEDRKKIDNMRYVAGGLLTGRNAGQKGFLGYNEFSLNIIQEGSDPELLTWMRGGLNKATISNAYLSALIPNTPQNITSSLNGGDRSCIACGYCATVCPTGIYPQLLMKSIKAGDIEESIALGLLDYVDAGLCTYVCPSKIDIDHIISEAKQKLAREALS